jgi:hypothetical protein
MRVAAIRDRTYTGDIDQIFGEFSAMSSALKRLGFVAPGHIFPT